MVSRFSPPKSKKACTARCVPAATHLPVSVFRLNGEPLTFPHRRAAAQALGWYALSHGEVGPRLKAPEEGSPGWAFVVREGGDTLSTEDLLPLVSRQPGRHARVRLQEQSRQAQAHFRRDPVPFLGPWPQRSFLRSPRTTGLLREAWWQEEGVPSVRPRLRNHPTRWDDLWRQDTRDRSWKRHRPHQWKET